MFVVTLKFAADRSRANEFMDAHKAWIKRGFDDGVFALVGSLQPNLGGAILAHSTSKSALQERLSEDPFVIEGIVVAEVLDITPARTDARLGFLMA